MHRTLETWKSALPGDPNVPMISRVVIDVDAAKVTRLQVAPDPHRSSDCDDISCDGTWSDVYWAPDGKTLAFLSTTRDHKDEKLRVADAATGAVRDVYEESTKTQFESGPGRSQLALSARVERIHLVHGTRRLGPPLSLRSRDRQAQKPDHEGRLGRLEHHQGRRARIASSMVLAAATTGA